jgi:Mrp family chromosome partitioning ATPase
LHSREFAELLQLVRDRYDYVIVDSPPLLAVSDSSVVAPMCDGVLLVLRMSRQVSPLAQRARDTLSLVDGQLVGIAVNAVGDSAAYGYGYDGYSYNPYGYGYGENVYFDEASERGRSPVGDYEPDTQPV